MKTIVLDAGHFTNQNFSPVYPTYKEGNMTWELYGYLKSELEKYGFNVKGTRSNRDSDLGVYERGLLAAGADLFISLHSNACNDEPIRRVVVIPPYKDTYDCYDLTKKLASAVSSCMGISEQYQLYTRTYADSYGRTKDYYGVIRGAVDAGCKRSLIIEHSFHTNLATSKWLRESANLRKLAEVEAKTIAEFFGIEWTVDEMKELEELKKKVTDIEKVNATQTKTIQDINNGMDEIKGKLDDLDKALSVAYESIKVLNESLTHFQIESRKADADINKRFEQKYERLEDVPKWGRDTVSKLIDKGIIKGTGTVDGQPVYNISETMLRLLVMSDRAGLYD